MMQNPRVIGHTVSVNGFRLKVEILEEARSPSRATLDGVQTAVAINAYLTFSIGSGGTVVGVVTDLEAQESYDPTSGEELSLELIKPRRIAVVQLLGTVEKLGEQWVFSPGITILPTLDTAAEIGAPEILAAIMENPPQRNRPEDYAKNDFDYDFVLGRPTGQWGRSVKASYNDLFSRPLAIVGNTGSGKSYTVANLLQKATEVIGKTGANAPNVFILDINGEYTRAFTSSENHNTQREPDEIYLNGKLFGIPIWFFNAEEVCAWLSASEQTQEPVLKDWWSTAKAVTRSAEACNWTDTLIAAVDRIDVLLEELPKIKKKSAYSYFKAIEGFLVAAEFEHEKLKAAFTPYSSVDSYNTEVVDSQHEISEKATDLRAAIKRFLLETGGCAIEVSNTADSPLLIKREDLYDPALLARAGSQQDVGRIEGHLTTLRLRLRTRLADKRWKAFFNYENSETRVRHFEDWLNYFGFEDGNAPRVSVIDLSMLSHEVLPYACGVVGRILLETRERLPANRRFQNPWVFVLEEAHNYAKPFRESEGRGQALSRSAFERIAKEGRKFGLSLIVASQRPSEISPTIISQCANFISHRLQNPDDIDHFRRIIPLQARRLLDQVTVLAAGEAIVFGSAFHIPMRVQVSKPEPAPWSQTAAPYHEWKKTDGFPIKTSIENWGLKEEEQVVAVDGASKSNE